MPDGDPVLNSVSESVKEKEKSEYQFKFGSSASGRSESAAGRSESEAGRSESGSIIQTKAMEMFSGFQHLPIQGMNIMEIC
jgi:hypothetical protein